VDERSVTGATAAVIAHLAARGFRTLPDDASREEVSGIYRGSGKAALALDVGDGVIVKARVVWIDPDRVGTVERAALDWAVPNRLVVSLSLVPSGC
jgi:hypothetical protein